MKESRIKVQLFDGVRPTEQIFIYEQLFYTYMYIGTIYVYMCNIYRLKRFIQL